jgi:hypothetical protein
MITFGFIVMCSVGFSAYYIGVIIRKIALPGKDSPTLVNQLLLGIPVSLVVVTPLLGVLGAAFRGTESAQFAALTTLGIIMEHGMLLNETLTKHLKKIVDDTSG